MNQFLHLGILVDSKRNGVLIHEATRMDPEHIILSERKKKSRFVVSRPGGLGVTVSGHGVPIWGDRNVLELVGMDAQLV